MSGLDALAPKADVNSTAAEDGGSTTWEQSYKPLPIIFLLLFGIWAALLICWACNTWTKRRFQVCHHPHVHGTNCQLASYSLPYSVGVSSGLSTDMHESLDKYLAENAKKNFWPILALF
jgi:hypothetical protein